MLAKQRTTFFKFNYTKDDASLYLYLSLNKLRLVLSLMNISSHYISFDTMHVMLCCLL